MKGRRGLGRHVESCVLWAPACTNVLFHRTFYRAIELRRIRRFMLFTLSDKAERDDSCASLYNKSLLYLISNALEAAPPDPSDPRGEEIVGMHARFRRQSARCRWVLAPNSCAEEGEQSAARRHGDFDDDELTLRSSFAFITDGQGDFSEIKIHQSASSKRECWREL